MSGGLRFGFGYGLTATPSKGVLPRNLILNASNLTLNGKNLILRTR